jgi:hypothetical protein
VNPADENGVGGVGGSTNDVSACPICAYKLPAKFKEALTGSGKKTSKIKRKVIIDGEEKAKPPKKSKTRLEVEELDTADTDQVNLDKGPKGLNTRVFSQASEDAQDTHANTEVSSNLDNLGNTSTEENERSNTRGSTTDEEEWAYLQLDTMATKDAQARTCITPRLLQLTIEHAKTLKKPAMRSSTGVSIQVADLIGIFEDGKHPVSGADAHFCRLCKKWLLRNVSTCCTHIIR